MSLKRFPRPAEKRTIVSPCCEADEDDNGDDGTDDGDDGGVGKLRRRAARRAAAAAAGPSDIESYCYAPHPVT